MISSHCVIPLSPDGYGSADTPLAGHAAELALWEFGMWTHHATPPQLNESRRTEGGYLPVPTNACLPVANKSIQT